MSLFTVLIPARMASTRLPGKPLLDIGGLPMVVRVARRAQESGAQRCVVATDDERIAAACAEHEVECVLTAAHHPSGSDRLAEVCEQLALGADAVVVNVQGDEPLIDPELIQAVADELVMRPDCVMSTAAHPIGSVADFLNPNVVKVSLDKRGTALTFSRAPIPWWRDGLPAPMGPCEASQLVLPSPSPLRHVGIYGYRAGFLRRFPSLEVAPNEQLESLEQLRVLWHGERIAVHVSALPPSPGVDTPEDLEKVRAIIEGRSGT